MDMAHYRNNGNTQICIRIGDRMNGMTIEDFIKLLQTYPQDAEITYAEVTAWTKDNDFIQWDTAHDLPHKEVAG